MVKEFNGYSFGDSKTRKKMRYIVVFDGDLDINGVYGFKSLKDLRKYLKERTDKVKAVFKVEDIT